MARFSSASMAATPQSPAATPAPLPASSTKLKRNRSSKSIHTPSARFWDEAERSKELRNGFSITLSKSPEALLRPIKKQRTLQHGDETGSAANIPDCEPDSFPESNLGDVYYNVEPKRYWEAALMNGLKKCVVEDETDEDQFAVGSYIHIRPGKDSAHGAEISTWIGKVLEIRAGDAAHVYVRIYWMYRPEDLTGGRRPYHGKNELIASNHMAVIDAHSVECSVDVYHWKDNSNNQFDPEEELYWRQTLDVTNGKKSLSQLDTYCIDHSPLNPDEPLLLCEDCNTWLHPSCLEENAVKIACKAENIPYARVKKKGKRPLPTPPFVAKFSIDNRRPSITIVDQRRGKKKITRDMLVECLSCGATIEEFSSRQPGALGGAGERKKVKDEEANESETDETEDYAGDDDEDEDEGEDNDTSKENESQEDGLEDEDRAMAATPKSNGAKKDRQSNTWATPARLIGSATAAISSVSRLFRGSST